MHLAERKVHIHLHMLDIVYIRGMYYYCHIVLERSVEKHVSLIEDGPRGTITGEDS